MGYPMTYSRVMYRNNLTGTYGNGEGIVPVNNPDGLGGIRGDLRRLEENSLDEYNLEYYADQTGLTKDQVKSVLTEFFKPAGYQNFDYYGK
jgi:hypothetical protein